MRVATRLHSLQKIAETRLDKLDRSLIGASLPMTIESDRASAYAVIELDNLWAAFVRSYYLSWFLGAKTVGGARMIVGINKPPNQFPAAIQLASILLYGKTQKGKTGRIEPAWHERRVLNVLATGVLLSHDQQVQQAMSTSATVFSFLHTVRNFYAHRCEETAEKLPRVARSLGLAGSRKATEVVLGIPPRGSVPVIHDWIAEVRGTVQLLCA